MRGKGISRFGVRTLPAPVAAAWCLVALAACSPSAIRVPAGKAETLRKIAVVPLELQGISGQGRGYFHGGGNALYLAGPRDSAVLGKEFGAVVVDGVPVFFETSRLGSGGPGRAERFEKLVTGPRDRWVPAVDLAEIAARRLRDAGVEATAGREAVRIPGLTRRTLDGVPLDWWMPVYDWYGKDPDPLDLAGYAGSGAQAVLVMAPVVIVPTDRGTHVWLLAKLVDPADGRVIGRAEADQTGSASRSVDDFPAAFGSAAPPAVEKALREMGLVPPK